MAQLVARYLGVVEAARSRRVTQTKKIRRAFALRIFFCLRAAPCTCDRMVAHFFLLRNLTKVKFLAVRGLQTEKNVI